MSDPKLTRRALEAALADVRDNGGDVRTASMDALELAARALLAATEPASDEEAIAVVLKLSDEATATGEGTMVDIYRAAEARVRRLAGFTEDE